MIFFTQEYLSLSFIHDIEIYNSHVQGFQILFLHFSVCTEYSLRSHIHLPYPIVYSLSHAISSTNQILTSY